MLKRTPLQRRTPLRPRSRTNSRRGRGADQKYLRWIRTLPCVLCGTRHDVEAAHTKQLGPAGMATKSPDRSAIPLCAAEHRLNSDSYHALTPESRWADYHGIDLAYWVTRLNHTYDLMLEARKCRTHRFAA